MENHYRIKTASGEEFHIYYQKGNGISLRSNSDGAKILLRNGFYDFDCAYDPQRDAVHIIGQDREGSIVHILHDRDGWRKKNLLEGKLKLPYPKYFRLVREKEKIIAVYTIRHDGNCLLVSQIPGEDEVPCVIDYVSEISPRFWAGIHGGAVSVIYIDLDGKRKEKKKKGDRWVAVSALSIGGNEDCLFLFEEDHEEHYITSDPSGGERVIFHYFKKNGQTKKLTVEEKEKDAADICAFYDGGNLVFASIGRERVRIYRFQNGTWETDAIMSECFSRQSLLFKVILLDGERTAGVGSMRGQRLSILLPQKEEKETALFTDKIGRLQAKIVDMERRLARVEQEIKRGKPI